VWFYKPFVDKNNFKEELEEVLNGLLPTKLLLSIESNNRAREYTFVFNGKNLAGEQFRATPTSTKFLSLLLGFGQH